MKNLFFALIILISAQVFSQTNYFRKDSVNFKSALLNVPYKNTLKMFGVAVDTSRRLAYINSLQTDNISIININSKMEVGELKNPFGYRLVNLEVVKRNGFILINNSLEPPIRIFLVNPQTNSVINSYVYRNSIGGITFYSEQKKIYLVDGNKVFVFSDTTLNKTDSITFPFPIGGIKVDNTNNTLLTVSRDIQAGYLKLLTVNLSNNSIVKIDSLPSSEPRGHIEIDLIRNKLYLFGKKSVIKANLTTKLIEGIYTFPFEIQKYVYNKNNEDIIALSKVPYSSNGLKGDWGRLYKYSFNSNQIDSAMIGLYPENMAFDSKSNLLVIPNMHSGYVDILNLNYFPSRDSIDVAVSLDYLALSPDRNYVFFAQRLGGSTIIKYNRITKQATEFFVGSWPAVVIVDSSLNKLFSLNHYEGRISAVDLSSNNLIGKIVFPINEPRTDAIGAMTYDPVSKILYAVFPEQNKILVGDAVNLSVVGTYEIPNYVYQGGKAVGVIQLEVAPNSNRLFVIINDSTRKVNVFNTLSKTWLSPITIYPWPNQFTKLQADMVRYDNYSNKVWIGNVTLNPLPPYSTKFIYPGDFIFLGYNSNYSKLYTLKFNNDSVFINTLQNDSTFTLLNSKFLYKAGTSASPVSIWDQTNQELHITEFNYGIYRNYKIDSLVSYADKSFEIKSDKIDFEVYPNPFNSQITFSFTINTKTIVSLKIYDLVGREISQLINQEVSPNNYKIKFEANGLASGIYFAVLRTGDFFNVKKIIYLR
jgi:hypothetical protein